MLKKIGLLPKIILAIALGIALGFVVPDWFARIAVTFNSIFGNFLSFIIPLLIIGLVAPGIADLGAKAGRMLVLTAFLAYAFTLFAGFGSYFTCRALFPSLLHDSAARSVSTDVTALQPYFSVAMPPIMDVMSALVLSLVLGLGMAYIGQERMKGVMDDLKLIIGRVISSVIIPLLPLYIFGIFLSMTMTGNIGEVMDVFLKLVAVIFAMTLALLLVQFSIAGAVARKNPLKMLRTMLTAYITALGTQSSAATIPVTMAQTVKLGVRESVAGFVIPLCATIHLSGSMLKIVSCSVAVAMLSGLEIPAETYAGFIMLLGITMIAAPGVPGGAIMAALGLLESMLGFDESMLGLMIATYIAMDSFGTATNVTGDGAVAVIIDRLDRKRESGKR